MSPRLYLDCSATSFPKAPGVYKAMLDYGTRVGALPVLTLLTTSMAFSGHW